MDTRRLCFSVKLPQEKVIKIIHIKEALNNKVHIPQKGFFFFSVANGDFFLI